MSLTDRIQADYQTALRQRETARVNALRLIRAALQAAAKDAGAPLDDPAAELVLARQAKQRRDSIAAYEQGGRADLVAAETAELAVIETYLPQPLSDDELARLVDEVVTMLGASSRQDFGRVMGQVMKQAAGRADGGRVKALVNARLGD